MNTIVEHTNTKAQKRKIIYLNPELLSDAPKADIDFDNQLEILNLKEQIIHGSPSCFVITGYRGVGKTSFTHYLKKVSTEDFEELRKTNHMFKERDIIFVNCNFVNGEKKEHILRKLIRELVSTSKNELKEKFKKNPEVESQFSILYKRTFNQIDTVQKKTKINIFNVSASLIFFILFFILIVSISSSFKGLLISIIKEPKYLTAVFSILTLILTTVIYKIENKTSNETEIKTLYDDEIAEVRLTECIEKLASMKTKVVFIIDELDKMEKEEALDSLIGQLKSILINEKATFILVTGQNFNYRLEKSLILDDATLPSIVTDTYHLPLPSREQFITLFNKIAILDKTDKNIYELYLNSVILRSKRIPRKFINIIRKDSKWDTTCIPPRPYIEIDEEIIQTLKRDNNILNCISEVECTLGKENNSQCDFLVSQLHTYAEKIKSMGAASFQLEEILVIDEDMKKKFPNLYVEKLKDIIPQLIDKMKRKGILDYDQPTSSYAFKDIIYEQETLELTIKHFLKDTIKFERFIQNIHKEIFKTEECILFFIIKDLMNIEIINAEDLGNIEIMMNVKESCLSGLNTFNNENIRVIERNLKQIRTTIIENYTYYVIRETLNQKTYLIEKKKTDFREFNSKRSPLEIDIFATAKNNNINVKNIAFYMRTGEFSTSRITDFTRRIENYIKALELYEIKPIKFVFIWFTTSIDDKAKILLENKIFNIAIRFNIAIQVITPNIYRDLDKPLEEQLLKVLKRDY